MFDCSSDMPGDPPPRRNGVVQLLPRESLPKCDPVDTETSEGWSGTHRFPRGYAALVMLPAVLLCWSVFSLAAETGLRELMQSMARVQYSFACYREEKQLAVLEVPLISEGILEYRAPDKLLRRVRKPSPASYAIDGPQVEWRSEGESRTLSLDALPALKIFVDSLLATLAGDLERLQQYYHVQFRGDAANWRLALIPKKPVMLAYVSRVELTGRGHRILAYDIDDSNGDTSRMQLRYPATGKAPAGNLECADSGE